jgi:hypothetical protein
MLQLSRIFGELSNKREKAGGEAGKEKWPRVSSEPF